MKTDTQKANLTPAERRISNRFNLSAETARLIAERAGLRSSHDDGQALALIAPLPTRANEGHHHV